MAESGYRYKPGDPWRVVPFMVLGAVLQGGLAIGMSAADSLFIARVGADKLPFIYACMPLVMLAYVSIYTRLLDRWGIDRLFYATMGVLALGGMLLAVLLNRPVVSPVIYYIAKFYASLWYIGLYTLLWNFVDRFFDLSEAKRLFGFIAGGSAVGAIIGGFAVTELSDRIGVAWLFVGWTGSAVATVPVFRWILRNVPRVAASDAGEDEDGGQGLADTLRGIVGNRYVLVFTLTIFFTLLTATLCEYRYYTIFEEVLPGEAELAALFGQLYAGVNVFNLVVTLFLFQVLVRWFGVRNVAFIQPVAYLVVFSFLLMEGGFVAGLIGFVAYQGLMTSLDNNNMNLLFNALPEKGKEATRTFMEGICEPMATASAGVFLIGAGYIMSDDGISGVGFGLAVVCLLLVLVLRVEFVKSVTANVRRSWLDFSRADQGVPLLEPAEVSFLIERVEDQQASDRERLTALRHLWRQAPLDAVERLLAWLPTMAAPTRDSALPWLRSILATDDPAILERCVAWAELHAAASHPRVLEEFGRRRLVPIGEGRWRQQSKDPVARASGAVVLWQSCEAADVQLALSTIEALLQGDADEVHAGWHALGAIGEARFIPRLLPHLRSRTFVDRYAVLQALYPLTGPQSSRVQPELLWVMTHSRRPEERLLIIDALARINDSEIIEPLLRSLGDTVPQERRRLEHLLVGFGPRAVPAAIKVLNGTVYPLAARSIAARALARVAFSQLEQLVPVLIKDIVRRAYTVVAFRHALQAQAERGAGFGALALVYSDLPRLMLELVLELLSVIGRLSSYDSIVAALRGDGGRERGFALESIEQACGRDLFSRLLPFLDDRPDAEIIAEGRRLGAPMEVSIEQIVAKSRRSAFPLEASAALQAAVEAEPARVQELCQDTLAHQSHPMVRSTARVLLRRAGGAAAPETTLVERCYELVQHAFFRNWGVRSLEAVALKLDECWHEPGEVVVDRGQTMQRFGVALAGGFLATTPDGTQHALPAPSAFGRESLGELWSAQPNRVVVTERARIMWMPAHAMHACIQAQPRLAIELLIWKMNNP